MAEIDFSIVAPSGDVIPLVSEPGERGDFRLRSGVDGFGVPTAIPRFVDSAGEGGTDRGGRTGMRDVDLPVEVRARSRQGMETNLRRLAAAFRRSSKGKPMLQAAYATGEVFQLPFVYLSGAESTYQGDGPFVHEWPLSLRCPKPYWVKRDAETFIVRNDSAVVGLLPDLSQLKVMRSQAIGSVTVENPGDVASPLTWILTGPGGPVHADIDGVGWTFKALLEEGDVITIDGVTKRVTDQLGRNRYSDMGPAPKFFQLPEGKTRINIQMENATLASRVTGSYKPRRELIY